MGLEQQTEQWGYSLPEGVSAAWTGGVEGMKEGKKKERRERSPCRGERCDGRFSQLPTPLEILRFSGLAFFLALGKAGRERAGEIITHRHGLELSERGGPP